MKLSLQTKEALVSKFRDSSTLGGGGHSSNES